MRANYTPMGKALAWSRCDRAALRASQSKRKDTPIQLAMPLAVAAAILPAHHHRKPVRLRGCHHKMVYSTRRAAMCSRAGRKWWLKHHPRPRFQFSRFELCVANREAGEPGDTSYSTINWHYDGDYEGAYNWTNSTWQTMARDTFGSAWLSRHEHAYEATPEQQTLVFRAHANSHDWPKTVPACGG